MAIASATVVGGFEQQRIVSVVVIYQETCRFFKKN